MLSPASLRVCCLAVMAPALTKADRQADCLPVVLSESFCLTKTSDTYNITTRLSDNREKCACYADCSHNKKPFMHRACWRTQKSGPGILCKYRNVNNDSSKSLLFFKGVRTLAKYKTWQSTKATTAYAGKIKLKYTMNKNTSNVRNMGLAKANTSLGLQRKLKRFSKENQSSGPINVMDDSLNFSDSADSPMHMAPLLTNIPNSDCDTSLVENVPLSCNHGRTSEDEIQNTGSKTAVENTESTSVQNVSEPFLSAGADAIEAMDTSNSSVTLTGMLHSISENNGPLQNPKTSASGLSCIVPGTCAINVMTVDTEVNEPQQSTVVLQPESGNSILEQPKSDTPLGCSLNLSEPLISKQESNSIFTNLTDLKLPVLKSKYSGNLTMGSSVFSLLRSSTLLTNATNLSLSCDKKVNCPVIRDCRFGSNLLIPVRQEKNPCCSPSSQELDSFKSVLAEKSSTVRSAVSSSARIHSKYLSAHIKKQIGSLVEHYQRNLQIPCQRPIRHAKPYRHLQDTPTENRHNEAMKHMSTSELVRFVQSQDTSANKPTLLSNIPSTSEDIPLSFNPEDCEDIKHTSSILLSAFKNAVKAADSFLTESSEEEYQSDSDDEETASETETGTTDHENALWKYMVNRTKLGSRSTWLLARIHELEFKIKEFNDSYNELVKMEGSVCLQQPTVCMNSSSLPESDESDLPTAVMKNFLLPLNGFLDRNDASRIARESLQSERDGKRSSHSDRMLEMCSRTRPLDTTTFRKRKIVVIPGLHNTNPTKFSRLSTVNCTCNSRSDLPPCILCTGQYHNVQSVDPETMALRDRIAILDPYFHPILSTEKEIPLCLHLENVLKTNSKYHSVREPSPEPNTESYVQMGIKPKYSDLRSHRKLSRYARTLSAKYRNKHHRTTKHLRKHKLVFGKWRRLHKHALRARNRFRRQSVASSGSSADSPVNSPVNSPMSIYDDGLGSENRKGRSDSQFDIDDVIIPCNSRSGRMVEIQYKEIMTPSWRNTENEVLEHELMNDLDEIENITDSYLVKRHELLEVEEKERMKRSALGLNRRRRNRCDSRADSSGANTPDPTSLYNNQDNVFQIPNFNASAEPASPASPATPNSAVVSDDSQPSTGNGSVTRPEKKKVNPKRTVEESTSTNARPGVDFDEVSPYEPLQFPLPDDVYEQLLAETDHNKEVYEMPSNTSSFPASPISSSSSTSTVEDEEEDEEDDDDDSDPEWTVIKPIKTEQALVLKFAKR